MSRYSLPQQGILGGRLHEAVGEDGGRPVRRLPHPQEKTVTSIWLDSTSPSPWGK